MGNSADFSGSSTLGRDMLDTFSIFTKGGVVLWDKSWGNGKPKDSPVDYLVREVLLQGKEGTKSASGPNSSTVQWRLDNTLELVFVVVYQNILQLAYVDDLLDQVRDAFVDQFQANVQALYDVTVHTPYTVFKKFDAVFDKLHLRLENESRVQKTEAKKPRPYQSKDPSKQKNAGATGQADGDSNGSSGPIRAGSASPASPASPSSSSKAPDDDMDEVERARLK